MYQEMRHNAHSFPLSFPSSHQMNAELSFQVLDQCHLLLGACPKMDQAISLHMLGAGPIPQKVSLCMV